MSARGLILMAAASACLAGCSAVTPEEPIVVTRTETVTATPEPPRVGLALDAVERTTTFAAELQAFLESGIEGQQVDFADTSDGCATVIAVYGAQLTQGALYFDALAAPTDTCDTDGVAVFRRVRDLAVVAEGFTCFGCDGDVAGTDEYERLISVYGNREPVEFEYNNDGELVPVVP